MEGTRGKIKGSGKIVTGAVDAAAGIAELSGAGAAAGVGIKAGSLVAKGGFAIANQVQKRRVKNKVLEQTGMNQTLDDYMQQIHAEYPQYHWDRNKGYPAKVHREAIRKFGTTPYHRMSFNLLGNGQLELFEENQMKG